MDRKCRNLIFLSVWEDIFPDYNQTTFERALKGREALKVVARYFGEPVARATAKAYGIPIPGK
jgi:hypothetical protein